ncbi:hypothetical protein M422DRAFT_23864 [Sphaerobolus stellatus SS14]|nr:hypothetical protein M422DRAFT_23864 [Sphaerobolus stellatus SS14]
MPLRSGSLVCDACWSTLFSSQSFHKAFAAKDLEKPSNHDGLTYTTQTWEEIDEMENKGCNWCDFLWYEIRFWYKHRTKRESPLPHEVFRVTVRFEKPNATEERILLRLVIENDWSPSYEVCCSAGMYHSTFALVSAV